MSWIDTVISEFGSSIGMPELQLDSERKITLDSDDGSSIGLVDLCDLQPAEMLILLSVRNIHLSSQVLRKLLKLADFRSPHEWALQSAASDREVFFALRIPQRAVSNNTLRQATATLKKIASNL